MKKSITKSIAFIAITLSLNSLFSTDIKSNINNNNPNVIYLCGENHQDSECINFRNQLLVEAKKENIILAREGRYLEEVELNSFGIEDKNAYQLMMACYVYYHIALYKISHNIRAIDLLGANELKKHTTNYFVPSGAMFDRIVCALFDNNLNSTSVMSNKNNKRITKKLNQLHDLFLAKGEQGIAKILNNNSLETPFFLNIHPNIDHWLKFFNDVLNLYCETLIIENETNTLALESISQIATTIEKIKEYCDMDKDSFDAAKIATMFKNLGEYSTSFLKSNLRNVIFLKNIIYIFENQKSQEKPFYAIIGARHVPFLYKELIQKGYQVELNNLGQAAYDHYLKGTLYEWRGEL